MFLRGLPGVAEVSIGHALIADALELGMAEAVRSYVATPVIPGTPGVSAGLPPVLCVSGKNACDDNSSTISGVVAN